MRCGTRLHTDQASRYSAKQAQKLAPPHNPLHNYLAGRIDPMQLENILGQINAKRDDRRF